MSKIGQVPVQFADSVTTSFDNGVVTVKGPEGELNITVPSILKIEITDGTLLVKRTSDIKKDKAMHGLVQRLISNAVAGVVTPWKKTMEVVGTGYKVKMQGVDLVFDIGYSHSVVFKQLEGVRYEVEGNSIVHVLGIDKQRVGEVAFMIKSIRKPDAYKGKGVRYQGEVIKLKPGKKAKTA